MLQFHATEPVWLQAEVVKGKYFKIIIITGFTITARNTCVEFNSMQDWNFYSIAALGAYVNVTMTHTIVQRLWKKK